MTALLRAAAFVSLLASSGCATIVNGTHQKVSIDSYPPGATVLVLPERTTVVTPAVLELERKKVHTLRIELPGYQTEWRYLNRYDSPWFYGNLLLGGIPGIFVDIGAGGAFVLHPQSVDTILRELPQPVAEAPSASEPAEAAE